MSKIKIQSEINMKDVDKAMAEQIKKLEARVKYLETSRENWKKKHEAIAEQHRAFINSFDRVRDCAESLEDALEDMGVGWTD